MERDGVAGNISTVNLLVGMGGGGVEVTKCLELAMKWGLRLNGYTYKCILQAHLRSREVSKGFEVYEEMRRKGYRLDIFAYNMLLDALAKSGMVDQAYQVFEDMKQKYCEPDAYTYTILIRMSGRAGKTSKFLSFFDEMVSKGCALNLIAYNTLIEALEGQLHRLNEVLDICDRYMNKSIYSYLVKSLSKSGHMWNSYETGDMDAFVSMLEVLCNSGKTLEAIDLLHMMPAKGVATDVSMYNMVFSALGKLKQVSFITSLFDKMKANGIAPDLFTYNIVISSYGRVGLVGKASGLFEEMNASSCKPDVITYNSLINCLGKNRDLDEAHMLFKEMQEKGYDPDVFTYSILIECFGKSNKVDMACSLFADMIAEGCIPNVVTYNILLDCLERHGKTAEAHKHYETMKQQGLTPDSITYSILERLETRSQRTVVGLKDACHGKVLVDIDDTLQNSATECSQFHLSRESLILSAFLLPSLCFDGICGLRLQSVCGHLCGTRAYGLWVQPVRNSCAGSLSKIFEKLNYSPPTEDGDEMIEDAGVGDENFQDAGVEQAVQKRDSLDDKQKYAAYVALHTLCMSRGKKFNRDDKKNIVDFFGVGVWNIQRIWKKAMKKIDKV
uniref:Pentacotripeptide-repeat region of PRORP domain-containing protein n=1 Tax=Aegilops tauschii TaxID=37682 RepID=M8B248_AEGTA